MGAFPKRLLGLKDTVVVVVTMDGMAFRGRLIDFSDDMVVLKDVSETTNQEIEWVEGEGGGGGKKGYIIWRHVALPEVIIRMEAVSRIWPWSLALEATKKEGGGAEEKEPPVYHMKWVCMG